MSKKKKDANKQARRAVAGIERAEFFAAGGSPQSWNGGRMWTAKDRRKEASRSACRQRIDP